MSDTMNQVVMLYTSGDGCSYSCDHTFPIYYESPEQAYLDFEKLATDARATSKNRFPGAAFIFAGMEFWTGDFFLENGMYYPPDFLTVQAWFDQQGSQA
jgi:hypothetical protein